MSDCVRACALFFLSTFPWCFLQEFSLIYRIGSSGLRPSVAEGVPEDLASLMRDCWSDRAEARPTFADIAGRLELLREAYEPEGS